MSQFLQHPTSMGRKYGGFELPKLLLLALLATSKGKNQSIFFIQAQLQELPEGDAEYHLAVSRLHSSFLSGFTPFAGLLSQI